MSTERARRGADRPLRTPGGALLAMPMSFADFDPKQPWSRAQPLTLFRAEQTRAVAAERAAEEALRARLDWSAHTPDDAAPQAEEQHETAGPAASRPLDEDPEAWQRELRVRRARMLAISRDDAVASARAMAESGALAAFPTASEYKTWSDERIAALLADAERDMEGTLTDAECAGFARDEDDPYDLSQWDDEGAVLDSVHPVNLAVAEVRERQRRRNESEAETVQAALSAWRVTEATLSGTPDAATNGKVRKGLMIDLANALQVAETTADEMVTSADRLERSTPRSWDVFVTGNVPWRAMRILHARLDGLDPEFLDEFDRRAAHALDTVAVPQLRQRLHEIREAVQATTAAERHKAARKRMAVQLEPAADGMAWLHWLLPAPEAVSIDARLDLAARAAAATDEEGRSIGALRSHILMDVVDEGLFRDPTPDLDTIAVPQRRGVQCKVGLLIPAMTAMGHRTEPAILEGYGPIDIETAKRLAGQATSWIKVLTDEVTGAVIDIGRDKYRPTDDMRALLGVLDRGGRGPNTYRPPGQTQADHVVPFRQGLARGKTALENLVLLARRDHGVKTSELYDIELRRDRDLVWSSWFGTRLITTVEPLPPTPVPERFRPPPDPPMDWTDPETPDELDCPF
jgi:hypothetical protein